MENNEETTIDFLKRETSDYVKDMMLETQSYISTGATGEIDKWALPLDEDGWTKLSPSEDSRLVYVATDGDDATASVNQYGRRYYLASDPIIGGDPSAPNNPEEIRAYKTITEASKVVRGNRWIQEIHENGITYDEYDRNAYNSDAFSIQQLGYPDWILFKRGQTFPLEDYYANYGGPYVSPGLNNLFVVLMLGGTNGQNLYSIDYNAGYFGGPNIQERAVITAWSFAGDHSEERPILEDHVIVPTRTHGNVAIISIDCTVGFGSGSDPRWWDDNKKGIRNVLIEDCTQVTGHANTTVWDGLYIKRSKCVDKLADGRGSGLFLNYNSNHYSDNEYYRICIEESLFDNNGMRNDPNEPLTWTQLGQSDTPTEPGKGHCPRRSAYNRNIYASSYDEFLCRGNIVGRNPGGGSIQMRSGGVKERNVFLWTDSGGGGGSVQSFPKFWNDYISTNNGHYGFDPYFTGGALGVADAATCTLNRTHVIVDNLVTQVYPEFTGGRGSLYTFSAKAYYSDDQPASRATEIIAVDNHIYSPGGRGCYSISNNWDIISLVVKNNYSLLGQPASNSTNVPYPFYFISNIGFKPSGPSGLTYDISNNTFSFELESPRSIRSNRIPGFGLGNLWYDYVYRQPEELEEFEGAGFGTGNTIIEDNSQFIIDAGWSEGATSASLVTYMESIDPSYVANENVYVDEGASGTKQSPRISYWKTLALNVPDENGNNSGIFNETLSKELAKQYHAFLTFIHRARNNRKGNWDINYTADAVNNYFREKFGKSLVGGTYSNDPVGVRILPYKEAYGQTLPEGSDQELEFNFDPVCQESSSWTGDTGENWTTLTPSQDSRLVYVATDGDDTAASLNQYGRRYYLPSDPIIGDDPTRPNNPEEIKAYATITKASSVMRCNNWIGESNSNGITVDVYDINRQYSEFPSGFPDWLLFRRGQTFNEDLITSNNIVQIIPSANEGFWGGRSENEKAVITSWGNSWQEPRPCVYNEISLRYVLDNIAIVSIAAPAQTIRVADASTPSENRLWDEVELKLDPDSSGEYFIGETVVQNDANMSATVTDWNPITKKLKVIRTIGNTNRFEVFEELEKNLIVGLSSNTSYELKDIKLRSGSKNILIEDCSGVNAGSMDRSNWTNISFRRCLFNDRTTSYNGSGMFVSKLEDEPNTLEPTTVDIEECIFDQNGYRPELNDANWWTIIASGGLDAGINFAGRGHSPGRSNLNRNIYASTYDSFHIKGCILSRSSGSGCLQLRTGGVVEKNLFIWNSEQFSMGSVEAVESSWKSGHASNNVITQFEVIDKARPSADDVGLSITAYEGHSFVATNNIISQSYRTSGGNGAGLVAFFPKGRSHVSRATDGSYVIFTNNHIYSNGGRINFSIQTQLDEEDGQTYKIQNLVVKNNNIYNDRGGINHPEYPPYERRELGNWRQPRLGTTTIQSSTGDPSQFSNGIGYTWDVDRNRYSSIDPTDVYFKGVSNYDQFRFSDWQSWGFDPNSTFYELNTDFFFDSNWSEPERSILTYMESIDPTYEADENVKVDFDALEKSEYAEILWKVIHQGSNDTLFRRGWVEPEEIAKLQAKLFHAFVTFIRRARNNRKGAWKQEYTAQAYINYIREGFGLDPIDNQYGSSDPDVRNAPLMEEYGFLEGDDVCSGQITTPLTYLVGPSGGTSTFNIDMEDDGCTWVASTNVDWLNF